MSQQHQQNQGQKPEPTKSSTIEPIWVICRSPFTALLPLKERALGVAGSMPATMSLRFERGVNILAGHVDLGDGQRRFVSLDQLPAQVTAMPEADRARELTRLLGEVRKNHPLLFPREVIEQLEPKLLEGKTWPTATQVMFRAVGTLKELISRDFLALREAAAGGTNKLSLQALVAHPDMPDDIKQLARLRLTAWNLDIAV